jgi:hypothetical protein
MSQATFTLEFVRIWRSRIEDVLLDMAVAIGGRTGKILGPYKDDSHQGYVGWVIYGEGDIWLQPMVRALLSFYPIDRHIIPGNVFSFTAHATADLDPTDEQT